MGVRDRAEGEGEKESQADHTECRVGGGIQSCHPESMT